LQEHVADGWLLRSKVGGISGSPNLGYTCGVEDASHQNFHPKQPTQSKPSILTFAAKEQTDRANMQRNTESLLFWLLGGAYLAYVIARAWLLPMTHDEVSTCANHVPRLVVDMVTYQREAVPNNHVLNTLAVKTFAGMFGMGHFVARLPALIGALLFVIAAVRISNRMSAAAPVRWFALIMLLGNPFVAEFMSLCRGYGLAAGLMLFAIERAWHYLENGQKSTLTWAMVLGLLAVEANFTLLNFYMPFTLLLTAAVWQRSSGFRDWLPQVKPVWVVTLILAILCVPPMLKMRADGELKFWSEVSFFQDTIVELMRSSTHSHPLLGDNTKVVLAWLVCLFSIGGWIMTLIRLGRGKWNFAAQPREFAVLIFLGAFIVNMLQAILLNIPFLNARTAVFYYPLFALQLGAVAAWLWERWSVRSWAYMAPILLFALINNVRCLNLRESYEWWYDAHTFDVIEYLRALQVKENHPVPFGLDCSPVLVNSFMFHSEHNTHHCKEALDFVGWHGRRKPEPGKEFFFTMEGDEIPYLRDSLHFTEMPDFKPSPAHHLFRSPR